MHLEIIVKYSAQDNSDATGSFISIENLNPVKERWFQNL